MKIWTTIFLFVLSNTLFSQITIKTENKDTIYRPKPTLYISNNNYSIHIHISQSSSEIENNKAKLWGYLNVSNNSVGGFGKNVRVITQSASGYNKESIEILFQDNTINKLNSKNELNQIGHYNEFIIDDSLFFKFKSTPIKGIKYINEFTVINTFDFIRSKRQYYFINYFKDIEKLKSKTF